MEINVIIFISGSFSSRALVSVGAVGAAAHAHGQVRWLPNQLVGNQGANQDQDRETPNPVRGDPNKQSPDRQPPRRRLG